MPIRAGVVSIVPHIHWFFCTYIKILCQGRVTRIFLLFGKRLVPAGGVYPHMVPEIVFVEIGEVDGDDVGDGVVTQARLAGKAGDAVGGQFIIFDIISFSGVRQPEHIWGTADAEVEGRVADDAGEPGRIESGDGKVYAGIPIFPVNPGEDQPVAIVPVSPGFDGFDAGKAGYPQ